MLFRDIIEPARHDEVTPVSGRHSRETSPSRAQPPFNTPQFRAILSGMVGKGHGIEAICHFLSLTREVLLELIVQLDLPTPHDKAYRRFVGARAWTAVDYSMLVAGYLGNWPTSCLSERTGRSRGSIYAKAGRLGLPKRDRRSLTWPEDLPSPEIRSVDIPPSERQAGDVSPRETKAVDFPPPETPTVDVAPQETQAIDVPPPLELPQPVLPPRSKLPPIWSVRGTAAPLELTSKRDGREVHWTTEALIELGMRKWGGQHIQAIARDFGVSLCAITSQLNWLDIPNQPRSEQTETFDRAKAEANIAAKGAKLAFCKTNERFPFWSRKHSRSKRDVKLGFYDRSLG